MLAGNTVRTEYSAEHMPALLRWMATETLRMRLRKGAGRKGGKRQGQMAGIRAGWLFLLAGDVVECVVGGVSCRRSRFNWIIITENHIHK